MSGRGGHRQESTTVTTPFDPSTRIVCPLSIVDVARPVPTTAGRPYSRHTIAACDITPPMSVTVALSFGNTGAQAGDVTVQTRISPSRTAAMSAWSRSTRAVPSTSPADAARTVTGFYRVYHSSRYVRDNLVLRLRHAISASDVERLADEFRVLIKSGSMQLRAPYPEEDDHLDLPRLSFVHTRHKFGLIRRLIDRINECRPA